MDFKIIADSSADAIHYNSDIPFESVPLKIIANKKEFVDDNKLDVKEMVDYLSTYKGKTSTACPSIVDYISAFGDSKYIICITITGTLSGSYNAACIAKDEYESNHPDRKVFVLNSLSAGPELKLLINKASQLISDSNDFDTVCKELVAYTNKTGLVFVLESLDNLAKNGRVNPIIAKAVGLLGIRIVGKASDKGDLQQLDKPRGADKAYKKLVERMSLEGYAGGDVIIDHCFNETGANTVADIIHSQYPNANVTIAKTHGLCSFYAEDNGMLIGFEKN